MSENASEKWTAAEQLALWSRVLFWVVFWTVLIAGVITFISAKVRAAEPCTKMHGLQKQEKAPCTGILGPDSVIREGAKCIAPNGKLAACNVKLEAERAGRDADAETHKTVLRSETKRADACCKIAMMPGPILPEQEWHETLEFGVVTATIVTGILVGLFVAVLYETETIKL